MSANKGYAAVAIQTSGLHPATSRMVSLDVLTFDSEGNSQDMRHFLFNPGEDAGPTHLHGLSPEELKEGARYENVAREICELLDDRILVLHDSAHTWGFIISESRRAMRIVRGRRRHERSGRGRSRRHVHVIPRPALIVDTLASARRQSIEVPDIRLRGLAQTLGLATSPTASAQRARIPEATFTRKNSQLTWEMYQILKKGTLATWEPQQLRADKYGLQRTIVRINAADTGHQDTINPKKPVDMPPPFEGTLIPGMEVVLAPEVSMDPDVLIEAALNAGLTYQEKLTRRTSLVVCNQRENLQGRAMHAARKGIPLISDKEFMRLAAQVEA
ncbi:MAG: DNA polymerase III subunit epsilon [Corynebacterium sp.]|nr:DNA polymerase III subunit epsilon [Corynebacterium sp.]